MIKRWLNRLRASREWVRALDSASRDQLEQTMEHIQRIEEMELHRSSAKTSEFDVYLRMLKAQTLVQLKRNEEAQSLIIDLAKLIKPSKDVEKEYLRAFLAYLAQLLTMQISSATSSGELSSLRNFDFKRIALDQVPRHLRRKFPLRIHPDWAET